jgi:hypothetical protein
MLMIRSWTTPKWSALTVTILLRATATHYHRRAAETSDRNEPD